MRIRQTLAAIIPPLIVLIVTLTPAMRAAGQHADEEDSQAAAGKTDAGKQAGADTHGHGEKPKPNLFPSDHAAVELGIWTLVVFILLLFVLHRYAWGPILEGLRKREENITRAAEEAKLAREETERVKLEFRAEMDKAYAEIPRMMEDARKDAANLRDEMKAKSAQEIQADRDRLRREIETAKDQALKEIWDEAAQLATLISAKTIGKALTDDDHKRLTEEALAEVKDAGANWETELHQFSEEWSRAGGSGNSE